jgi:hypothetical protein
VRSLHCAQSESHDAALNSVGLAILDGLLGDHRPGLGSTYLPIPCHERLDSL